MCSGMVPSRRLSRDPLLRAASRRFGAGSPSRLVRVRDSQPRPTASSGAGPGGAGRPFRLQRLWPITTDRPTPGLMRWPTSSGQRVDIALEGGSANATASTLAVELERHGSELPATSSGMAATASGLGVMAARSTAGIWARWASAPTTTPGRAKFLLISSSASVWPVASASATRGSRLASVSYPPCTSAWARRLDHSTRVSAVHRAHATTRRTSSRVVSPSMALRRPLWRSVIIPCATAILWISSTDPPSMIIRSISSVMGISSASAFRPR